MADIENYMNAVERVLEYTQLEAEEDLKRYPQVQYSTVQYSTVQYITSATPRPRTPATARDTSPSTGSTSDTT